MTQHLPLNGDGVTDKVSHHLYAGTGNGTGYVIAKQSPALALKRAIQETYSSSDHEQSSPDGGDNVTGCFADSLETPQQKAVDPSQGQGASTPTKHRDPLLKSLEGVLRRHR